MVARAGQPARLAPIILILIALSSAVRAAEDPREWLARMHDAVEYLNYEGTLVHVAGDDSSVLKIVHRVENGNVSERITSVDAGREIIRTNEQVTCIFPDERTVLVEPRDGLESAQSPLQESLPVGGSISEALYLVAFGGTERIAGRETQQVAIRPKDSFRYGYRIWLDQATAMPVKTQLLDDSGRVLEQLLFSEIELPSHIPLSAVRPSVPIESFSVRRSAPAAAVVADRSSSGWVASEVPPGFRLTVSRGKLTPGSSADLRHLVYSDGLATVSLFIEPAVAASEQAEGLSEIGAANAYTTTSGGYMITAMGEVPARTVELLARSTRPSAAAADR